MNLNQSNPTIIASDVGQQIQALAIAATTPMQVGDVPHVILPPGYQRLSLQPDVEKARPAPSRKQGTVALYDVDSFIAYCADQRAQATAYIFADIDARTFTAVFNDAKSDTAGWRDHRATFKAELTPEAQRWIAMDGKPFGQNEFAEFIEDNFADLQGEDAPNLLTLATTIAATTGINFSSAKRLQDGQTQLVYNEVIEATAGADGQMKIPKTFTLGMRLFKNGGGYLLTARLKYRLGRGAITFTYELERHERAIEDAFKGYVEDMRNARINQTRDDEGKAIADSGTPLGYSVLLGKA